MVGGIDVNGNFIGDHEGGEDIFLADHLVLGFDVVGAQLNIRQTTSTASLQSPFPFLVYCLQ